MAKVAKQRRVWMYRQWYKVITSPDPLVDSLGRRGRLQRDPDQGVLWTDPALSRRDREQAIMGIVLSSYDAEDQSRVA